MTRQDELLLELLALDAERLALGVRDFGGSAEQYRPELERACARVFASIDMVISRLDLDHRAIASMAELETERFGLIYRPVARKAAG